MIFNRTVLIFQIFILVSLAKGLVLVFPGSEKPAKEAISEACSNINDLYVADVDLHTFISPKVKDMLVVRRPL